MTLRSNTSCLTYYEGSDGLLSDFPPFRTRDSTPDPLLNRQSSSCSPVVRRSKCLSRSRRSPPPKKGLGKKNIVNMVQVTVEAAKVIFELSLGGHRNEADVGCSQILKEARLAI